MIYSLITTKNYRWPFKRLQAGTINCKSSLHGLAVTTNPCEFLGPRHYLPLWSQGNAKGCWWHPCHHHHHHHPWLCSLLCVAAPAYHCIRDYQWCSDAICLCCNSAWAALSLSLFGSCRCQPIVLKSTQLAAPALTSLELSP